MELAQEYNKTDCDSIRQHAKKFIGKCLRPYLPNDVLKKVESSKGKGDLGLLVEKYWFGIEPNNRPEPDLPEAGVEIKTAGIVKKKDRYLAKEPRLSLGMIDYSSICDECWEKSSLLKKNSLLLLLFYLYQERFLSIDHIFKIAEFWQFPERDLRIIKQDWETIVTKIKAGKAHELSEGNTYYLGATTKGQTAKKSLRSQPYSDQPARSRAFSLKKTYLETIIADLFAKQKESEPVVKDDGEFKKGKSFEDIVIERFDPFICKSVDNIARAVGVSLDKVRKDKYAVLARAIMGVSSKKVEEFEKADVQMKTIRIDHNSTPEESMSFPNFNYMDIIKEKWEDSELREQFSKKFFFVVFKYTDQSEKELVLHKVMFWNMPYSDLETKVKKVWKYNVEQIKTGNADTLPAQIDTARLVFNNRITQTVSHVRPHGRDSTDTIPAPGNKQVVKKCFWLNASYIKEQIL